TRTHLGFPNGLSISRIDCIEPPALLARANEVLAIRSFERNRRRAKVVIRPAIFGISETVHIPHVAMSRLITPDHLSRFEVQRDDGVRHHGFGLGVVVTRAQIQPLLLRVNCDSRPHSDSRRAEYCPAEFVLSLFLRLFSNSVEAPELLAGFCVER